MTRHITERTGGEERIGRDGDLVIDTRSTRVAGAGSSKRKTVSFKYDMDRCPDAGGIGRGPVSYAQHDRWVIDRASSRASGGGRAAAARRRAAPRLNLSRSD